MIHPDCFQLPWLRQQAEAMRVQPANLHLLERCIHSLELVGRLSDAGLDFVFKGGTSLVLLLQPVRRLSIDVDIATPEPIERIKAVLDQVADNQPPFLRYEHARGVSGAENQLMPPIRIRRHYLIHWNQAHPPQVGDLRLRLRCARQTQGRPRSDVVLVRSAAVVRKITFRVFPRQPRDWRIQRSRSVPPWPSARLPLRFLPKLSAGEM